MCVEWAYDRSLWARMLVTVAAVAVVPMGFTVTVVAVLKKKPRRIPRPTLGGVEADMD